jgi:hypothetical protein
MKIAYCFSGMIRSLDECGPKWKEIIEKNPGDVYGHFWDISDRSNDNDTVDKFVELFNPKKIEIENFESFKESTIDIMMKNIIIPTDLWLAIQDSIRGGRFISFHYKIWKANQLSLQEKYDVIVRCRTDYYPDTNIKFEINNMINVPTGMICVQSWNHAVGPIDLFAYGNRKLMNYYSCVYLYIMKYLNQGFYCYPYEYILGVHLNHKDMSIRELPIDIFGKDHGSHNSWAPKVENVYNTSPLPPMDPTHYAYIENRSL